MRNLQTKDIFNASRLIKSLGIKEEIKNFCMKATTIKDLNSEEFGFDLLYLIFDKSTEEQAEKEIYTFIASFFECSPEEIAEMDPCEMLDKCLEVADVEKWKSFFSHLVKLIQSN